MKQSIPCFSKVMYVGTSNAPEGFPILYPVGSWLTSPVQKFHKKEVPPVVKFVISTGSLTNTVSGNKKSGTGCPTEIFIVNERISRAPDSAIGFMAIWKVA